MATNYPGPYQVRIHYTVTIGAVAVPHVLRLNCDLTTDPAPGTLFSAITMKSDGVGTSPLQTEVDFVITLLQPLYNIAGASFTHAELWKYTPLSFEAQFVSSYLIGVAGTSGTGVFTAGELIYVFRTREGGIMKVTLEETSISQGAALQYASMAAIHQAVADYFSGVTSAAFWLGRDTSYPFNFIHGLPGQNEAIFKRRFRS